MRWTCWGFGNDNLIWLLTPSSTAALMQQQPHCRGHRCAICCFRNLTVHSADICLLLISPIFQRIALRGRCRWMTLNSRKWDGETNPPTLCFWAELVPVWSASGLFALVRSGAPDTRSVVYSGKLPQRFIKTNSTLVNPRWNIIIPSWEGGCKHAAILLINK